MRLLLLTVSLNFAQVAFAQEGAFSKAASLGDIAAIRQLVSSGFDILSPANDPELGPADTTAMYFEVLRSHDKQFIKQVLVEVSRLPKRLDPYFYGNPLMCACQMRNFDAIDALIEYDVNLLMKGLAVPAGGANSQPPAIVPAVKRNDVDIVRHLLERGFPPAYVYVHTDGWRENLLSFVTSESMRGLLIEAGVPPVIPYKAKGTVTEDRVRLRDGPNLEAPILAVLSKNASVDVQSVTAERQRVNDMNSPWFEVITTEGLRGWVYGYYVDIPILGSM